VRYPRAQCISSATRVSVQTLLLSPPPLYLNTFNLTYTHKCTSGKRPLWFRTVLSRSQQRDRRRSPDGATSKRVSTHSSTEAHTHNKTKRSIMINKKSKRIIILEFKRASDTAETYYSDMKSIAERQHTPILEGLNALTEERGWVVEVLPLVAGQRSVREKEWLEAMKTFGISTEDGKRIIYRLGSLLLSEHEKLFGSYWRQVFGPSSSLCLMHLLGKDLSVRASNSRRNRPRVVAGLFFLFSLFNTCIFYYRSLSPHTLIMICGSPFSPPG
jgi:hypothetical protein